MAEKYYTSYTEYLLSEDWKAKARQRAMIDGYKCCMCGSCGTSSNPLECHHISYRNIFREDTWKDLLTLCRNCHRSVHRMMNRLTAPNRHGWKDELSAYSRHVLEVGGVLEGVEVVRQ